MKRVVLSPEELIGMLSLAVLYMVKKGPTEKPDIFSKYSNLETITRTPCMEVISDPPRTVQNLNCGKNFLKIQHNTILPRIAQTFHGFLSIIAPGLHETIIGLHLSIWFLKL
jgi:hypothetical protein